MNEHRAKLQSLLRELFQFDTADLDFGIYRIMNQRRADIDAFIQTGLLDAVAKEFQVLDADAIQVKQTELNRVAAEVKRAYGDTAIDTEGDIVQTFAQLPLALQYTAQKAEVTQIAVSTEAEKDIFNALYTFFSRYYDGGDFITKRRYSRKEKYAIPYNGEEVYFHWANRDQYYVKTADVLTDYAFRIESHGGYRVCFKLIAANTEQNNVKGEKRFFLPGKQDVAQYDADRRELTFWFEYRPLTEEEIEEYGKNGAQAKILQASRDRLLKAVPDTTLRGLLATPPAADDDRTPLDLHLYRWTRKSTSDFFIHKDLHGFLERELDFYLKNEIMRLNDLNVSNSTESAHYLTRVAVIKSIGDRIIEFLAQIEDFQKRLFEKPKFVLASEWCVTLDRVPKSLHPAILANDAQWQEWARLFGVRRPKNLRGLADLEGFASLTIDTAFYDAEFKDQLLSALSDTEGGLAAQTDGLLIHSENFQALTLLQLTFRERVKCIYIDPPYNTSDESFVYKNGYKHSSWISMMEDRVRLAVKLLPPDGILAVAIDDTEAPRLRMLLDEVLDAVNRVATLAIEVNPAGQNIRPNVPALSHDYCYVYAKDIEQSEMLLRDLTEEETALYSEKDAKGFFLWDNLRRRGGNSRPTDRPNQWYPLYVDISKRKVSLEPFAGAEEIWPIDPQGEKRIWRTSPEGAKREIATGEISVIKKAGRIEVVKKSRMPEGKKPKTLWKESIYSATSYGTKLLNDIVRNASFTYPKSVFLVQDCLQHWADQEAIVLDFFAGSGTTAHAVINLNRKDEGNREYILVEQGAYFDTVLKPRVQKVIYASEWKDGQPVEGAQGSSHAFQYLRLESYEDTLDNLDLALHTAPVPGLFLPEHDDYLLKYVLDHETRRARLNTELFTTPFDYELRVRRNGAQKRVKVDLVETANYLLGLTVTARRAYTHQNRAYRVVLGTQGNESIAVIWRNTSGLDLRQEAEFVSETFEVSQTSKVYINGDSHVPDARPIEDVFMQAMRGESRRA